MVYVNTGMKKPEILLILNVITSEQPLIPQYSRGYNRLYRCLYIISIPYTQLTNLPPIFFTSPESGVPLSPEAAGVLEVGVLLLLPKRLFAATGVATGLLVPTTGTAAAGVVVVVVAVVAGVAEAVVEGVGGGLAAGSGSLTTPVTVSTTCRTIITVYGFK